MTMKNVNDIAIYTNMILVKNSQIVNSKGTNPKFKSWLEKLKFVQMEMWLKSNLTTDEESETYPEVILTNFESFLNHF